MIKVVVQRSDDQGSHRLEFCPGRCGGGGVGGGGDVAAMSPGDHKYTLFRYCFCRHNSPGLILELYLTTLSFIIYLYIFRLFNRNYWKSIEHCLGITLPRSMPLRKLIRLTNLKSLLMQHTLA